MTFKTLSSTKSTNTKVDQTRSELRKISIVLKKHHKLFELNRYLALEKKMDDQMYKIALKSFVKMLVREIIYAVSQNRIDAFAILEAVLD